MNQFSIVILGFIQLLLELVFALCCLGNFTRIAAVVYGFLHADDFTLVSVLHLMQIFNTEITYGIGVPTVHIYQNLAPILLTTIKQPVNWAFLVNLDMILDEIILEIIANHFSIFTD